jgi:hypothetical protein
MRADKLLIRPRISRPVGLLASAFAALGVLPPIVSKVRLLLSLPTAAHYAIHVAWQVFCLSLVLLAVVWLHLDWKARSPGLAGRALGALLAVSAPAAGGVVWTLAPDFWIVWPTYGQSFQYGLCLWALATSHRRSTAMLAATTVTTGGLLPLLPKALLSNTIGIYAIGSFFVFLWLAGILLHERARIATILRAPLLFYVLYHAVLPPMNQLGCLCLAAIVLTELRFVLAPPNGVSQPTRTSPPAPVTGAM